MNEFEIIDSYFDNTYIQKLLLKIKYLEQQNKILKLQLQLRPNITKFKLKLD